MTARRSPTGTEIVHGRGCRLLTQVGAAVRERNQRGGTAVDVRFAETYPARPELLARQAAQMLDVIAALEPRRRVGPA